MDLDAAESQAAAPGTDSAPAMGDPYDPAPVVLHSDVDAQEVSIDWWEQIMAGGWTMVPLVVLSVAGVFISVQRLLTIRVSRIAPLELEPAVMYVAVGTDDSGKVWINGKEIWQDRGMSWYHIDEHIQPFRFRQGVNRVLVRLENDGGGATGFSFLVCPVEALSQDAKP
ncbi:MAG: hypothetical protein JXB62_01220 [Pirellulales bacterium]|nr:hypothetical protein [Pirellulales bacterium]